MRVLVRMRASSAASSIGGRCSRGDTGRGSGGHDAVAAEVVLDVRAFRERLAACRAHEHPPQEVCPDCLALLREAAALYGGDFLAGFTLRDSPAFDEWQFFQAERLREELISALTLKQAREEPTATLIGAPRT